MFARDLVELYTAVVARGLEPRLEPRDLIAVLRTPNATLPEMAGDAKEADVAEMLRNDAKLTPEGVLARVLLLSRGIDVASLRSPTSPTYEAKVNGLTAKISAARRRHVTSK